MRFSRSTNDGFTLIEAVASVAAIAIVSIPLLGALSANLSNQKKVRTILAEREFALSWIEKIDAERAFFDQDGIYMGRFQYQVKTTPIENPLPESTYSALFYFLEVTVHVQDNRSSGDGFTLRRIVATKPAS